MQVKIEKKLTAPALGFKLKLLAKRAKSPQKDISKCIQCHNKITVIWIKGRSPSSCNTNSHVDSDYQWWIFDLSKWKLTHKMKRSCKNTPLWRSFPLWHFNNRCLLYFSYNIWKRSWYLIWIISQTESVSSTLLLRIFRLASPKIEQICVTLVASQRLVAWDEWIEQFTCCKCEVQ